MPAHPSESTYELWAVGAARDPEAPPDQPVPAVVKLKSRPAAQDCFAAAYDHGPGEYVIVHGREPVALLSIPEPGQALDELDRFVEGLLEEARAAGRREALAV